MLYKDKGYRAYRGRTTQASTLSCGCVGLGSQAQDLKLMPKLQANHRP